MSFIEYLISIGYKPYRKKYNRSTNDFYYEEEKINDINFFSSTTPGYLDLRLVNGNKEIIYGLHEYGHPPTLIYPELCARDAETDRLFMDNSYEHIYSLILKKLK